MSEQYIISLLQGDINCFKMVFDRYWDPLYRKACKKVGEEEAEDMVQEVMLTLWKRKEKLVFEHEEDLSKYLHTAMRYRIISHYAAVKSEIPDVSYFDNYISASCEQHLETRELAAMLENSVAKLPEKMQLIFRLSRNEDVSIKDIALRLNLSEQTVKNQITEALKRIRVALKPHISNSALVFFGILAHWLK